MGSRTSGHSPDIFIQLEIGEKKISLADVLYNSATLFENAEVLPQTKAFLVFSNDGLEQHKIVVLDNGIKSSDSIARFSYTDPRRNKGQQFAALKV